MLLNCPECHIELIERSSERVCPRQQIGECTYTDPEQGEEAETHALYSAFE
jgi:hypothetical protein